MGSSVSCCAEGADPGGVAYTAVNPTAPPRPNEAQLEKTAEQESTTRYGSGATLENTASRHLYNAASDVNNACTHMAEDVSVLTPTHRSDGGREEAVPEGHGPIAAQEPGDVVDTAPSGLPPLLSAGISFSSAVVVLHSGPSTTSGSTGSALDDASRDSPQLYQYDGDDDALGEQDELGEDISGSGDDDAGDCDDDDGDDGAFAVLLRPPGRLVHAVPVGPTQGLHEMGTTMVSIHRPLLGMQSPFAPPSTRVSGTAAPKASAGSPSDSPGALVRVVLPGRRLPHKRGEPKNSGGSSSGGCYNSYNSHDSSFSLSLSAISAQHLSLIPLAEDTASQRAQLAVCRARKNRIAQRRRRTQYVPASTQAGGLGHEEGRAGPLDGPGSTALVGRGSHNEHAAPMQ